MTAVLFLLRAVVLVLLWGFVIAAIVAVRHDVFGTSRAATTPAGPRPAKPRRPDRADRGRAGRGVPRRLVVVEGARSGTSIELAGAPVTIGRAEDSTLVLGDDYVSSHHARLVPRADGWVVEDLGSTNGTYVGRERLTGARPVPAGARIRVGKTVMELRA